METWNNFLCQEANPVPCITCVPYITCVPTHAQKAFNLELWLSRKCKGRIWTKIEFIFHEEKNSRKICETTNLMVMAWGKYTVPSYYDDALTRESLHLLYSGIILSWVFIERYTKIKCAQYAICLRVILSTTWIDYKATSILSALWLVMWADQSGTTCHICHT